MQDHPLILFDGICNYCNSWVNFAIRHDKNSRLRFTPLQSETGQALKKQFHLHPDTDSVILIDNNKAYTRSQAILRIIRHLDWPARIAYAFIIVPAFLRDPIYNWVARNRYKWFGKKETCMIPDDKIRSRFL